MYDMAGRFITSQEINSTRTQIDLSHWSSGMYLIKVTIDHQTIVKQIIKE
nr:T9SS type A sorting domain-containing protein [Nonlabens ulvanivorans]